MKYLPNEKKNLKAEFKQQKVLKAWHKLLYLSPILLIIFIYKGFEYYNEYQLKHNGVKTWAKITKASLAGVRNEFENNNIEFEFFVNDSVYYGYTVQTTNHRYVIGNLEIPIFPNQEYELTYVKENPSINKINFSKPNVKTILMYIQDVSEIIQHIEGIDSIQSFCIAFSIFKNFHYKGLAQLYFYDEYTVENFKYNSNSFEKFWQTPEIVKIRKNCIKK